MKITSKSTKSQIFSEYNRLKKENTDLGAQLLLAEEGRDRDAVEDVEDEVEVVGSDCTVTSVADSLERLRNDVRTAFGSYQNEILDTVVSAREFSEKLEAETRELYDLYGVEFSGTATVNALIAKYNGIAQSFADEVSKVTSENKKALNDLLREKFETIQELATSESFLRKDQELALSRDEEEYSYLINKHRAENDRKLKAEVAAREASRAAVLESFDSEWKAKDTSLKERFDYCLTVFQDFEKLTKKLEQLRVEAVHKGTLEANKVFDRLEKKDVSVYDSEMLQYDIDIRSLTDQRQQNTLLIEKLQTRLKDLTTDVQALSQTSLNSQAKGAAMALEAVERIVVEQAKAQPNSKRA